MLLGIAILCVADDVARRIAALRDAAIEDQPWPCQYDRGVLPQCVGSPRSLDP